MTNLIERIRKHITEDGDCWVWHGALQSCGAVPMIRYDNRTVAVRRAILLERGVVLAGRQATYTCGNELCVNPEHTASAHRTTIQKRIAARRTQAEEILRGRNIALAIRAKSPRVKRSLEFARTIRAAEGSQREIAKRFSMTQTEVSEIRRGRIWKEYEHCPLTGMLT
jgi:predicted XRE-type DNA-binding protein